MRSLHLFMVFAATQTLFNFVRLFRKSDEENQKIAEMERKKAEKDKENQKNAEIERKKAERIKEVRNNT